MNFRAVFLLIGLCLFFTVDDLLVFYVLNNFIPLNLSTPMIILIITVICVFSVIIGWLVFRAMQRKPTTGKEGLIGENGKALTSLNPVGQVFVRGEIWQAVSDDPILKGEEVQVFKVEGLRIYVKKIN